MKPSPPRATTGRSIAIIGSSLAVVAIAAIGTHVGSLLDVTRDMGHTSSANPRIAIAGAEASSPTAIPAQPEPFGAGAATVQQGSASVSSDVRSLTAPRRFTGRSLDGAVSGFASMATWLIASPAARSQPALAVEEVAAPAVDPATSQTLANMLRSPGDDFRPEVGAYRVRGYSGGEGSPDQVIVEVVAPLTLACSTRWVVVGGVVTWTGSEWKLFSMAPRELPTQPTKQTGLRLKSGAVPWAQGPGWRTFARSGAERPR